MVLCWMVFIFIRCGGYFRDSFLKNTWGVVKLGVRGLWGYGEWRIEGIWEIDFGFNFSLLFFIR